MEAAWRPVCLARELRNRLLGEWAERDSNRRSARELSDHEAHWVLRPELVVAERHDEDAPCGVEPAAEVRDRVERRLVGPVHVLEHGERRRGPELREEGSQDGDAIGSCGERVE
ncbi:MAG TPA: hypothetical protein VFR38_09640 [Gaiellaceae bacterium]|nr:hypothetical protein [Gaiellaceae bacterium]